MNIVLQGVEKIVSNLGHPDIAIKIANSLLENQQINGYKCADIGRKCELRGRIDLGKEAAILNNCSLRGDIRIGRRSRLGSSSEVMGNVNIGKYCAIAREVTFQQTNHQMQKPAIQRRFYEKVLDSKLELVSSGPITIGNDVWIGTKAIILSDVDIGDGAVIGAGSVVTDDVEPYAVVAGTPARRVNWRFPEEVREELQELAWWEWSDEKILDNKKFFNTRIGSNTDIVNRLK